MVTDYCYHQVDISYYIEARSMAMNFEKVEGDMIENDLFMKNVENRFIIKLFTEFNFAARYYVIIAF